MSILDISNTALIQIIWSSPCDLELSRFYCTIFLLKKVPFPIVAPHLQKNPSECKLIEISLFQEFDEYFFQFDEYFLQYFLKKSLNPLPHNAAFWHTKNI